MRVLRAINKWMESYAVPFGYGLVFGQVLLILALAAASLANYWWSPC